MRAESAKRDNNEAVESEETSTTMSELTKSTNKSPYWLGTAVVGRPAASNNDDSNQWAAAFRVSGKQQHGQLKEKGRRREILTEKNSRENDPPTAAMAMLEVTTCPLGRQIGVICKFEWRR